jgi:hypothetical protein
MPIEEADQVPVKVTLCTDELWDVYEWILRRDLEWVDLRFLVNSKLGHNRWEAEMAGEFWNGQDKVPMPDQKINIFPLRSEKAWKKFEKRLVRKQEAWDRVSAAFQGYGDWHLDEVPTEDGSTEPVSNEEDYSIAVEFPGDEEIRLMRIPKGEEWAFFDTFVRVKLGEDELIAAFDEGFGGGPWQGNDRLPRPGQRVRVFWIKEKVKEERKIAREEKTKEFTQAIFSRPKLKQIHPENEIVMKEADVHPTEAGGKFVPMEKIHIKEQQPLSSVVEYQHLARVEKVPLEEIKAPTWEFQVMQKSWYNREEVGTNSCLETCGERISSGT